MAAGEAAARWAVLVVPAARGLCPHRGLCLRSRGCHARAPGGRRQQPRSLPWYQLRRWSESLNSALPHPQQAKVQHFTRQLQKPDHVLISSRHARRRFGLSREQLAVLNAVYKPNPYANVGSGTEFPFYWKPDVVALALQHYDQDELVRRYAASLETDSVTGEWSRKIFAHAGVPAQARWLLDSSPPSGRRWYKDPPSATPEGAAAVKQGLLSNSIIFTAKAAAWFLTRSPTVFADMMHSLADVCNYLYRLKSLRSSQRSPDAKHPYGYAPLRSVCADRSFVILLGLGGMLPFFHGMHELIDVLGPEATGEVQPAYMLAVSAGVLAVSIGLEAVSVAVSYNEIRKQAEASQVSFRTALMQGQDLMSSATFLESVSGAVGGAIGIAGVGIVYATGQPWFDPAASVLMATMVSAVAASLLHRSSEQLLQAALPKERTEQLIAMLEDDDVVAAVYDVKTQVFATEMVRFKAEIHWNAEAITRRRRHLNEVPGPAARDLLSEFKELQTEADAEDWLMRNDAHFLQALAGETDRLEDMLRGELRNFKRIHVDLETF